MQIFVSISSVGASSQILPKCDPTHGDQVSGNLLDLVLLLEDQCSGQLVSDVSVQAVCFSDHRLVKCCLGMPPTTASYDHIQLPAVMQA